MKAYVRIDNEQYLQKILNGSQLKSVVILNSDVVTISFGEWGKLTPSDHSSIFVNIDVAIEDVGDYVGLIINSVDSINLSVRVNVILREKAISMANEYNIRCFHIHENGIDKEVIVGCRQLFRDLMSNNLDEEVFSVMAHEKTYSFTWS